MCIGGGGPSTPPPTPLPPPPPAPEPPAPVLPTPEPVVKPVNPAVRKKISKKATGKTNQGGRKFAKRLLSDEGFAVEEVITTNENDFLNNPDTQARELQTVIFQNGEIFNKWNVHEARAHCRAVIKELPKEKREIHFSSPAIPTTFKEV